MRTALLCSLLVHAAALGLVWGLADPRRVAQRSGAGTVLHVAYEERAPVRAHPPPPPIAAPARPQPADPPPEGRTPPPVALPSRPVRAPAAPSGRLARPLPRLARPLRPAPEPAPVPEAPSAPAPAPAPEPPPPAPPPLVAPRLVPAASPPIDYPARARRRGLEGRVVLAVWIDAAGRVARVEVAESSGSALLDRAAADGVRSWRFEPATRGGRAVAHRLRIPIRFELE